MYKDEDKTINNLTLLAMRRRFETEPQTGGKAGAA